jgi:hypothetical protein
MLSARRKENKRKSKFIKIIMIFGVLMVLAAAEIVFDVFEIVIGKLLLFSNPVRPQIGRLWEEDKKEQIGIEQLDANVELENNTTTQPLRSLEDLQAVLSIRSSMNMTRAEFKEFYKSIPIRQAKQMLDPLDLIALDRSVEWRTTQLSFSGDQLVLYFLDGYEQPIKQTHFTIEDSAQRVEDSGESSLDQNENFENRIISAAAFFQAFDQLPRSFRLQIVNDPYKLVRWGAGLKRVGISRIIDDDGVEMIFEVSDKTGLKHYSMFASRIAIEYLVNELKNIDDAPEIQMPVREYESDEKDN